MDKKSQWIVLSDEIYNGAKFVTQIALPAVATLYFALAQIWGFPHSNDIVGSITAVDAFLGVLLGISTKSYNASDAKYDGSMNVADSSGKTVYSLDLNADPESLSQKQQLTFKVNK